MGDGIVLLLLRSRSNGQRGWRCVCMRVCGVDGFCVVIVVVVVEASVAVFLALLLLFSFLSWAASLSSPPQREMATRAPSCGSRQRRRRRQLFNYHLQLCVFMVVMVVNVLNFFGCFSFLLFLCHHESLEVGGVDLSALDLELRESVVDLLGGELVAPGHKRVLEPGMENKQFIRFREVFLTRQSRIMVPNMASDEYFTPVTFVRQRYCGIIIRNISKIDISETIDLLEIKLS
jgi:hypothetical protein